MIVLRDEDRGPKAIATVGDSPAHLEAVGDFGNCGLQASAIGVQLGHVELDALEELAGHRIGVLVSVEDVGTVAIEELCQGRDEAFAVGTADEQRCGLFHGQRCSR